MKKPIITSIFALTLAFAAAPGAAWADGVILRGGLNLSDAHTDPSLDDENQEFRRGLNVALLTEAGTGPARLLVGVPYNMDGSPTRLTSAARKFARELSLRHGLQVALVDERQSSQEAEAQLREARRQGVKRRRVTHADVDMAAAKVLLERWLETPQAAEIIHPGRH